MRWTHHIGQPHFSTEKLSCLLFQLSSGRVLAFLHYCSSLQYHLPCLFNFFFFFLSIFLATPGMRVLSSPLGLEPCRGSCCLNHQTSMEVPCLTYLGRNFCFDHSKMQRPYSNIDFVTLCSLLQLSWASPHPHPNPPPPTPTVLTAWY